MKGQVLPSLVLEAKQSRGAIVVTVGRTATCDRKGEDKELKWQEGYRKDGADSHDYWQPSL